MGTGKADKEAMLRGLRVYRASRLEALVTPLEALLEAWPPDDLLAPQFVLAAHPGMQRWLTRELARRRGPADVVANLDVRLPSAWLDDEVRRHLGSAAMSLAAYRRDSLRWTALAALDAVDDPGLRRYLEATDAHRRFQLADRLAAILARLLVYRPDWLAAWAQGRAAPSDPPFLAPLWRSMQTRLPGEHRGALLQALARRRREAEPDAAIPTPLHVFGFSHLPALEFAVLCAEARHRLVCLYFPDPCVQYWAGLGDDRARLQRLWQLGPGDAAERELQSLGHPLLAAWGRMGQHFGLALLDAVADTAADVRHGEDEHEDTQATDLLAWLQQGIRHLQPDHPPPAAPDPRRDASLRVHGCHTRVRELEVLRDAILDALSADARLLPGDIAVMAPDIAVYAPLLPAIFGDAADRHGALPWHCADLALRRAHPLFDAFLAVVQLPRTRIEAAQVLDLLAVAAIRRALEIDEDGVDALRRWLDDARVAWGLDAASRAERGLPAYAEHSFAWGMARLVAGHVYGEADAEVVAAQTGLWPVAGVEGVPVAALGGLDRLLGIVADWRDAARTGLRAMQWCARLESLLDALFAPAPGDADATAALAALRAVVQGLREPFRAADADPELAHATLCALVDEALARVPERQPFLLGGITFCGMVPQRSIPFRMIAVLGLNDGEFPRANGDDGLDPMTRHARIGDRDTCSDDRYLFLETLMAARQRLHLSYHHEGAQDGKPRNPAAPLAELMAFLDARLGPDRPWFVAHPLQPFDARCFDGVDPRLASFSAEFAAMRAEPRYRDQERFVVDAAAAPVDAARDVPLASLLRFLRDPAADLLRDRLRLRLDALTEDRSDAREPLSPIPDPLERLPHQLLLDALAHGRFALPDAPPQALRLSGRLPAGRLGQQAYRRIVDAVDPLLKLAAEDADLAAGLPPRRPVAVDLDLGAGRLHGTVSRVYVRDGQWLLFDAFPGKKLARLDFRQRLPLFVEWAALRLAYPGQALRLRLLTEPATREERRWDERLNAIDAEAMAVEIRARLARLVGFWQQSGRQPLRYLPKTAWAAAGADAADRGEVMRKAWLADGRGVGERDYAPGYARLLARGLDPSDPASAEGAALIEAATMLRALIEFDDAGDAA